MPPVKPDWPSSWKSIRHHFAITAFGVNAVTKDAGSVLIPEHDETASGQQELYFVHAGGVTATLDGEPAAVGAGGLIAVEPAVRRKIESTASPTTLARHRRHRGQRLRGRRLGVLGKRQRGHGRGAAGDDRRTVGNLPPQHRQADRAETLGHRGRAGAPHLAAVLDNRRPGRRREVAGVAQTAQAAVGVPAVMQAGDRLLTR